LAQGDSAQYFADVTGDGFANAIKVNAGVVVRRAQPLSKTFGSPDAKQDHNRAVLRRYNTLFVHLNGDKYLDIVALNR
jgi:hypothetical protein